MRCSSPELVRRAVDLLASKGTATGAELARHVFGGERFASLLASLDDDRLIFDGAVWSLALARSEVCPLEILASGPNPDRHRIVEIAALRQGRRFHALIDSGKRTPRLLARLGVPPVPGTDAVADDQPWLSLDAAARGLREFLAGATVAGFGYEPAFLAALLGPAWPAIDLVRLLMAISDFQERPDPLRVAKRLGLAPPRSRRPLAMLPFSALLLDRLKGDRSLDELLLLAKPLEARPPACPPLPMAPGVYVMSTVSGHPLYVGKSVDLRRRVRGYLSSPIALSRNMDHLMHLTDRIKVIPVATEVEALMLESRLIAAWKPAFNIQRRPQPAAIYLRLTLAEAFPRLSTAAEPAHDGATYFGPFRHAAAAARLRALLGWLLRLRTCSRRLPSPRKPRPACDKALTRACLAPCIPGPPAWSYRREAELACSLLSASPDEFRRTLLSLLAERPPSPADAHRLKRLLERMAAPPLAQAPIAGVTALRLPEPGGRPDAPPPPIGLAREPAAGSRRAQASPC